MRFWIVTIYGLSTCWVEANTRNQARAQAVWEARDAGFRCATYIEAKAKIARVSLPAGVTPYRHKGKP